MSAVLSSHRETETKRNMIKDSESPYQTTVEDWLTFISLRCVLYSRARLQYVVLVIDSESRVRKDPSMDKAISDIVILQDPRTLRTDTFLRITGLLLL